MISSLRFFSTFLILTGQVLVDPFGNQWKGVAVQAKDCLDLICSQGLYYYGDYSVN